MPDNEDYDRGLQDVRMKIAMEKNEWFKYFKVREAYIKLMIISFFTVWFLLGIVSVFLQENSLGIFVVPNIVWMFICFPYFAMKIIQLSSLINLKKEEVVVCTWKNKTHNIKDIILITGLEKIFVEYYLSKNGLINESKNN